MRSVEPTVGGSGGLSQLQQSGKPVTNPVTGFTAIRIRVLAATLMNRDTGFRSGGAFQLTGGDVSSAGVGLSIRNGASAKGVIPLGIPGDATVQAAYLYWMTSGGPDNTAFFPGKTDQCPPPPAPSCNRTGTLVGASRDLSGNSPLSPIRVYRALIPVGDIDFGHFYAIQGVGSRSTGVDGVGASLVVVYSRPSTRTGRIVIQDGALTGIGGETLSHTFSGLSVPTAPVQVRLHVGIGDGQSGSGGSEDPMKLAGGNITGANAFFGVNGPRWDARNLSVPTNLLPQGTTTRVNSVRTIDDSLAWGYAVLSYQ
jgi:hypothetical protein